MMWTKSGNDTYKYVNLLCSSGEMKTLHFLWTWSQLETGLKDEVFMNIVNKLANMKGFTQKHV